MFFFFFFYFFLSSISLSHGSLLSFLNSLPLQSQALLLQQQWSNTSHFSPCIWPGVSCSSHSPFPILSLNLSGLDLTGHLAVSAPHLCDLPYLKSLDLSLNQFTGPIPTQLFNCSRIESLRLDGNFLSGSIPQSIFISNWLVTINIGGNSLTGQIPVPLIKIVSSLRLEYLALYDNSLTGSIPKELLQFPNLKYFYLYGNNLTGPIPNFPPHCNLIELYIYENALSGTIPSSLGNCRNLTSFIASSNKLEGTLQNDVFVNLSQLELLYLDGNRLSGELPTNLTNLTKLKELLLSSNQFVGSIPEEIGMCRSLVKLSLWDNHLTGAIPPSIGNLMNLESLLLARNSISGPLPGSIGKSISLVELQLQENLLNGSIPNEICELVNLEKLYLFKNKLEGNIPTRIGKMKSLSDLQLYNNFLTGEIPREITLLRKLSYISLANNKLSGEIPSSLGKYTYNGLISIDLTGNLFYGPIPPNLCFGGGLEILDLGQNQFNLGSINIIAKCESLTRVILRQNQFHGSLPTLLSSNSAISYLDLSGNFFEGKIPKETGLLQNLSMLDLSDNMFTGPIPIEIGNLANLEILRIGSNRLTGSIPPELGNCQKLVRLDLSQNLLSGQIPKKVLTMANLQNLLLYDNLLIGPIPDSFTAQQALLELQLGNNFLEGSIPHSLGNLQFIYLSLNLSTNNFTGEIPSSLGNLDKLQVLDLSKNSLSGQIPSALDNMISLAAVNLSFNQLSGNLPSNWVKFLISSPGAFLGNPSLCQEANETNYRKQVTEHGGKNKRLILVLVFSLGIIVLGLGMVSWIVLRACHMSAPRVSSRGLESTDELPEDLTYDDIMRATDNLSEKYVIGRGRHGTVYCTESGCGKTWAIKMVNLSDSKFCSEMRILGSVKHRNLVKMAGYCIRDGFGLIVCEYMSGGTLFELLHDRKPHVALDWESRYKIALGVAQGLAYLHHDCVPKIVHRDVKSSNVLMDSEHEPKLADFGLAKFVNGGTKESNTVSAIVGTLGYIAPENGYSSRITEKCDVYSYGVLLLELVCRRLPVDPIFGDGIDIVQWTNSNLKQSDNLGILNCLDTEIIYWVENEIAKAVKLLELGISCTQFNCEARPSMREVLKVLIKLDK